MVRSPRCSLWKKTSRSSPKRRVVTRCSLRPWMPSRMWRYLDIEMPGGDGLSAAAELKERLPSCHIIILTTFGRAGYLKRAMESGALGFMLKDAPATELASAIRRVMGGKRVVDPGLAASALSEGDNPLTDRERDVLQASGDGATIEDIAARLYLSEGTVRNYLSTAIKKLGTRNRVEAARLAERKGWL